VTYIITSISCALDPRWSNFRTSIRKPWLRAHLPNDTFPVIVDRTHLLLLLFPLYLHLPSFCFSIQLDLHLYRLGCEIEEGGHGGNGASTGVEERWIVKGMGWSVTKLAPMTIQEFE